MADPKEDEKKSSYKVTSETRGDGSKRGFTSEDMRQQEALEGKAPGGYTGQINPRRFRVPSAAKVYGPDDRQRYLEDVAKKAFEHQNPEQGPMTAYQAAEGDEHAEAVQPLDAQIMAQSEIDRGEDRRDDLSRMDVGDFVRVRDALQKLAEEQGISFDQALEALSQRPSVRYGAAPVGTDPAYRK